MRSVRRVGSRSSSRRFISKGGPLIPLTEVPYFQMNGLEVDIHNVARAGESYNGVIGVSNDYTISWEVIDSITLSTRVSGIGNSIVYTFLESDLGRAFDVKIIVSWGSGSVERYLRRQIRYVSYPVFNPSDPDVTVIDVSTDPGFHTSPPATHKVLFTGVRASGSMNINGWSIASETIVIQNQGQVQLLDQFVFGHSSHNIILDGCCDNSIQYGFLVDKAVGTGDTMVIAPGQYGNTDYSDNILLAGVRAEHGNATFHILPTQSDPDTSGVDPQGTYPVTQLDGFRICNCYSYLSNTEAYYIGFTRDYQGYSELSNLIIHHCVAYQPGWDGFQPGNAVGVELHNCEIYSPGQRMNGAQWSGISTNGFTGIMHHCLIDDAFNAITGSTGRNHGGYHIFRNKITSTRTQETTANYHCWNRLGDNYPTSIAPVDLAIYRNEFDTDGYPFETFLSFGGQPEVAGLNFYFENNTQANASYPQPTLNYTYFVANGYTEHFMAQYDFDGYKE